jgi:regulator of sigma E protease
VSGVLPFILLIGPLIFIHELGHLLAAKLVDVKVGRFSIGFGPPLLRIHVGETEYCLAPIPLGGYVTLLGQNPHEDTPPQEADRSLTGKPLWARYLVLGAGPLANLLLPLLVYFFFFIGHTVQAPPIVGTVLDDSAAAAAGLQPNDRVVSIDDQDVRSWKEMQSVVSRSPDRELRLQIERDGKRFDRFVTPRRSFTPNALGVPEPRGLLGIYAWMYAPQIGIVDPESPAYLEGLRTGDLVTSINGEPARSIEELERLLAVTSESLIRLTYLRAQPVEGPLGTYLFFESHHAQLLPRGVETGLLPANTFISRVEPDSPADRAGLRTGDRVLAIDGAPITRWETLAIALQKRRTDPITLEVQTMGEAARAVTLAQESRTRKDIYRQESEYLWFGAHPHATRHVPDPEPIRGRFTYAARSAWDQTIGLLDMMWLALRQLVTLQRGVEELSSVVGIFNYADTAWEQGPGEFLMLTAFISLNLALVNLLPIPILDGGHLLFFTLEAVRRRPLGRRAREIASIAGLVVIVLLLLIALRNDIVRFWID